MTELLWLALWFVVQALFRRDPVSFGLRCCQLALDFVSFKLCPEAKSDWADEFIQNTQHQVWDCRKRGTSDEQIGAWLVWDALSLLANGWALRKHYARNVIGPNTMIGRPVQFVRVAEDGRVLVSSDNLAFVEFWRPPDGAAWDDAYVYRQIQEVLREVREQIDNQGG